MSRQNPSTLPVILLLALLLAACAQPAETPADQNAVETAVALTLTAHPTNTLLPTSTSLPTATPLPPTSTPEPPTASPTATSTLTLTPTPVLGDPAIALGNPSGFSTFDNTTDWYWSFSDNECFKNEITGGQFLMEAKGVPGVACWSFSWPVIQNYYLETRAVMPASCDPADRFGFIFRAPDNDRGYLYGLACDGQYSLTGWTGDQTIILVSPARNDAIKVGAGEVNRIGVLVEGNEYKLYANGILLAETSDPTFPEPGMVGYFIRAASDQPFTSAYDDIAVWVFDEEENPSP